MQLIIFYLAQHIGTLDDFKPHCFTEFHMAETEKVSFNKKVGFHRIEVHYLRERNIRTFLLFMVVIK